MPDVILAAEKHPKDAHNPMIIVQVEPENCPIYGDVSETRHDVVLYRASVWCLGDVLACFPDLHHTPRRSFETIFQCLAEVDIRVEQVVKDKFEIVLGFFGELNGPCHALPVFV